MISLQLQQLTKSYGPRPVFEDITLSHKAGVLGIAGSNGSGKSTLLKCLGGLLRPDSGHIIWKIGEREFTPPELKPHLGYSGPYISLYKELTVRENLKFLARLRKTALHDKALDYLLSFVDLAHSGHQLFGNLSTGQQQRARIASSIFHDPAVLLLDEPGSNLDENGREVIARLREIFSAGDKRLVIASNDGQELAMCDRIFSLEQEAFI